MRAILATIIVAIVIGGGGVYAWRYFGGFAGEQSQIVAFIDAYGAYADVAEQVELLVHIPGTEGNQDRAELLGLLNSILTESMDDSRREELARLAFTNLTALKKEIDAAQAAQAQLYETLHDMDTASRAFVGIGYRHDSGEVVSLARKRAELSARITSILSETNDHTYAIITRILEDAGVLTTEHIQDINVATDAAEQRFDTLSELYAELMERRTELEQAIALFAQHAV